MEELDDSEKVEKIIEKLTLTTSDRYQIESDLLELVTMHVREIGSKVVYIESVRPKWRRHDLIEIGTDLHQLFAHMEV